MNYYTHMLIGEALTAEYVDQLVKRMQDHVRSTSEMTGHSILAEEGGRMVVLMTDWSCRQTYLQYHASREYRQFIAASQHMLVDSYVVKLFQNKTERRTV